MASTNFLIFDEGKQNMMSDGDYSANTQRARGVTPGIAYPNLHNKLYYQVSVMAKAIADFMVAQGVNASDEDVEQLTVDIATAFTNFVDNKTKDVYLPLSGGTMKGNINASGHNITATKFIGNLQGNADSADKLGSTTVGSTVKPIYLNNGVATPVSIDLSTLAPKESPAFTGIPTAPTPDISDDSDKIVTTAFARKLVNSAIDIVRGKLEPTLTPLIDWDAMASANGDTDVRNINNTTYGVTAYGGDSKALNRGDIIFKQAFNMFDAIIIEHTNDTGERHDFTLIPMWLLNKKINTKGCFDLLDTNNQHWITRGNLCPTRPSTTTRFNVWEQNCGIIEIYGVTYKTI